MSSYFRFLDSNCMDDQRLDLEFRQILCIIKDCIPYVNCNYKLTCYRSWLEKLSNESYDKHVRNSYLLELARQIKGNFLVPPFNQQPPLGTLNAFADCNYSCESDVSIEEIINSPDCFVSKDLCQITDFCCQRGSNDCTTSKKIIPSYQKPKNYCNPETPCSSVNNKIDQSKQIPKQEEKCSVQDKNKKLKLKKSKSKHYFGTNEELYKIPDRILPRRDLDAQNQAKEDETILDNVQTDSSWCDLSDCSVTSVIMKPLGAGDSDKRGKYQPSIKNSNEIPSKLESEVVHDKSQNQEVSIRSARKADSNEFKYPLKDTHFIVADWKKTIEALQLRLTETLSQNNELKIIIDTLRDKMNVETTKKEQNERMQKRITESHKKEMEMLRNNHEESLEKVEKNLRKKLDDTETMYIQKIDDIKMSYENTISNIKSEHESDIKEKDREIVRLSEIIQEQCVRMANEIASLRIYIEKFATSNMNEEKGVVLHRCISKMDKLFHKSEKEYQRHIDKLKQELELKNKIYQIQLKSQRAELISRTSAEKQKQFDEVVNSLEIKYIKMLDHYECEVTQNKKQEEDKLEYLKDLLERHEIPYNIP